MEYKTVSFKAADDFGKISGYFSTYDEVPDSYGDIVAPGAFADTIKAREATGHPFPLCINHDINQIAGQVDSIEDTEKGPLMTASFFNTPLAQEWREIVAARCSSSRLLMTFEEWNCRPKRRKQGHYQDSDQAGSL